MDKKLLLGIFIPLILIITLVVMSSTNVWFSMEKNTRAEIPYADLFSSNYRAGEIAIQTITVKNDYFLDKRIDLPKVMVCLYDKENNVQAQNLNVRYNTGKATDLPPDPITGIVSEASIGGRYYNYGSYTAERNVDVPAHKTKDIKLMIQPKYSYDYYSEKNSNADFDGLLIIESDNDNDNNAYYSSNSCQDLDDEDIEDAQHIKINKEYIPGITCETIPNLYDQDTCYFNQATINLNISMCRKISQVYQRDSCFSSLARSLKDVSLCYEIVQGSKDQCFFDLASVLRDKSICNRITDSVWKNSCNSIVLY